MLRIVKLRISQSGRRIRAKELEADYVAKDLGYFKSGVQHENERVGEGRVI